MRAQQKEAAGTTRTAYKEVQGHNWGLMGSCRNRRQQRRNQRWEGKPKNGVVRNKAEDNTDQQQPWRYMMDLRKWKSEWWKNKCSTVNAERGHYPTELSIVHLKVCKDPRNNRTIWRVVSDSWAVSNFEREWGKERKRVHDTPNLFRPQL